MDETSNLIFSKIEHTNKKVACWYEGHKLSEEQTDTFFRETIYHMVCQTKLPAVVLLLTCTWEIKGSTLNWIQIILSNVFVVFVSPSIKYCRFKIQAVSL